MGNIPDIDDSGLPVLSNAQKHGEKLKSCNRRDQTIGDETQKLGNEIQ
jgi:hypothetical protein